MATGILNSRETLLDQLPVAPASGFEGDTDVWSPDTFAREQIRGLVRQVFFSNIGRPVRQVVFSAVEPDTDVGSICRQAGEALARETQASVAVVCGDTKALPAIETPVERRSLNVVEKPESRLQHTATRLTGNLWLVHDAGYFHSGDATLRSGCPQLSYSRLADLRREFEYSIVQSPAAGESSEAAALGQLADGIILVLAAHKTRRAAARKIVETLRSAQVQFLGTVLSERTFPIPEGIYRRL